MDQNLHRRRVLGGLTALIAAGPAAAAPGSVTLTFLHFNDVYRHGPSGDFGGLAHLATLMARERAAASGPVFQTFGGDILSPSITSSVTQGAHMIDLLNALGTQVAVLGNHEFDFGSDIAAARIQQSRFPWLGANVLGADGQPFGGTIAMTTLEADGIRVGFVGVLTTDTARLAPHADGIRFTNEESALREGAAALRREGADIVVALTHQGIEADIRMAKSVPGIDLVLGGHDHEPAELLNLPGVPVLKAASDARWLAVAELHIARPDPAAGFPARVRGVGWRLVPNMDVAPSPTIQPMIDAIDAQTQGILGQVLGRLGAPLDSRTSVVRAGEAAMGNLVADGLRAYFRADIALINGGGLRGDRLYAAGTELTRRDLVGEMPFGNVVMELEISGATLRTALEHGLSELEETSGRFPQVSGLRFLFDPSEAPGYRLREVMVGTAPLDPSRAYTLATTDYLAAGGDGYDMLKPARVLVDAAGGPLLVNVAAESVAGRELITVPTDGRAQIRRR